MHDVSPFTTLDRPRLAAALAARFADSLPAGDAGTVAAASGLWARGGRAAALERLERIDPATYARTRNHVTGAVTRLSPWLRHGMLSTAEVRDRAVALVPRAEDAAKLVAELGWREYWRQVQAALGEGIRRSIEAPAQAPRRPRRVPAVPADVLAAGTGMPCIDDFVRRLHADGWLHNHERMWLASWLVHVRGVRWEAGADWFLSRLVDGDPASNHLSWQWVAGTFAAKPYIFNRENLETWTSGSHCRPCPLAGRCDLEGTYEDLTTRLFATPAPLPRPPLRIRPAQPWEVRPGDAPRRPLVWLTLDSLGGTSPAAAAHPDAPRLFVVDPAWLEAERPSLQRLVFVFECLADSPGVRIVVGPAAEVVPREAAAAGCDGVAVADTPCPGTRAAALAIREAAAGLPVAVRRWPRFCDLARARDLGRFSRFWAEVGPTALRAG